MEVEIWKSNLNLKFEIRFKQKSKFWVLCFIFWKIENTWKYWFFKRSLGDVTDQRREECFVTGKILWKNEQSSFLNFYWKSK